MIAMLALAPSALADAVSTTDNPPTTPECVNGSPVNCNIYLNKEDVWLSGLSASLAAGDYYFAVLVPGAQQNPTDGSPGNLSCADPTGSCTGGTWTDREFSVAADGTVTTSGSHTLDATNNKLQVAPYDDTTNPGGVYIVAVCPVTNGMPDPGANCKFDAFKVKNTGCAGGCGGGGVAGDPVVTKDAAGSYDTTYAWTMGKSVDKTLVKQIGGTVTLNYTVTASYNAGTVSNVKVKGTITVQNPNADAITGATLTDQLSNGVDCTVTGDTSSLPGTSDTTSGGISKFPYTCSLSGLPRVELDNTATLAWPQQTLSNGDVLVGNSGQGFALNIQFTSNNIDNCATATDTFQAGSADTLGTVCTGNSPAASNLNGSSLSNFSESFDGMSSTFTFKYSRTVSVPAHGCVTYSNTASGTTNTNGTVSSFGPVTSMVCGPALTSALTIGFWKNTNGNSLIANYCAPAGKTSLATYLSGLGTTGSSPFKDASGLSCANLVKYVNNILVGATATNMNVMLKAQMLATALDVYFSGPGWTSTSVNKTKPPSTFLLNGSLGGVSIDTTAVCPMVDNTTAGTATCANGAPATDGVASLVFPSSPMSVQQILDYEATNPPFNGITGSGSIWYSGNATRETVAKNMFDQINNGDAFAG